MDVNEKQKKEPIEPTESQSSENGTSPQAAKIPTDPPSPSSPTSSTSSVETPATAWLIPVIDFYNSHFAWVSNNSNWSKVKPVIRCAVAAWVSAVLFLIPAFELAVGQVSGTFLLPPNYLMRNRRRAFLSSSVCTSAASETSTKSRNQLHFYHPRAIHSCLLSNAKLLSCCLCRQRGREFKF